MLRPAANSLMILFTAIAFLTLGRAPNLVRFRTRDLEIQISAALTSAETS